MENKKYWQSNTTQDGPQARPWEIVAMALILAAIVWAFIASLPAAIDAELDRIEQRAARHLEWLAKEQAKEVWK